jgi:phospholipid transport system substrate-binding protein
LKSALRILALCFFALSSLGQAQAPGPEELVKRIIDDVMGAIHTDRQLAEGDREKALRLAEEKILPHLDFEEATRLAASRAWPQASAEQRRKLVNEFRSMLVRTYTNAIGAYGGQQMKLLPSRTKGGADEATVRCQFIRTGGRPLQVAYEMRRTDGAWKIYDINVEGMSMVLAYRSEFDSIIKQEGVDGLIRRLAQKNAPAKIPL